VTSDKCYENKEIIYPYRETDPLGGKDPYSASKACAEIISNSYLNSFFNKNSNTKLSSVRSGNIFGGGDWSENRIIPDFFRSILISKPLLIRNPNSVRPWQYVLEPLYGYLLLASKLYSLGDYFSGSWNFGPDRTNLVSVKDLISSLIKISSKGSYEITSNIDLPKEAGLLTLDITKAVNLLNWSPKLNLEKSLELTIEEYNVDKTNYQYNLEQRINHINYYMSI
jgi:CDP-glucose 4,6-dehydratase